MGRRIAAGWMLLCAALALTPTPDGQRFIMAQGSEQEQAPTQLTLVLGWLGELDRRVPKGKK